MTDLSQIKEHMEVIGADGVHLGTVDKVEGDRIKLTKADSGSHSDTTTTSLAVWSPGLKAIRSACPPTPTTPPSSKRKRPASRSPT